MYLTHQVLTTLIGVLQQVVDTPTPTPGGTPQQMSFPEVTTWLDNFTVLIKTVGIGAFLLAVATVAILFMTSFGNERRAMLARAALVSVVLGLILLLVGFTLQTFIYRITGVTP